MFAKFKVANLEHILFVLKLHCCSTALITLSRILFGRRFQLLLLSEICLSSSFCTSPILPMSLVHASLMSVIYWSSSVWMLSMSLLCMSSLVWLVSMSLLCLSGWVCILTMSVLCSSHSVSILSMSLFCFSSSVLYVANIRIGSSYLYSEQPKFGMDLQHIWSPCPSTKCPKTIVCHPVYWLMLIVACRPSKDITWIWTLYICEIRSDVIWSP